MNLRDPQVLPDHRVWDSDALGKESQFALLGTRDYLSRRYAALHGGALNAGKAREIIAHLAQGNAYFAAARDADELVTPLLQYYGVLAFARAVILFRTRQRESALLKSHGLSAGDWSSAFASEAGLLEAQVSFGTGTLSELCDAVNNTECVDVDCYPERAYVLARPAPLPASGTAVSLLAVLERMPHIRALFSAATGRPPRTWEVTAKADAGHLVIDVMSHANAMIEENLLRNLTSGTNGRVEENIHRWAEIPDIASRSIHLPVANPDSWSCHLTHIRAPHKYVSYLVEPFPDGSNLPTVALTFVAAFMVGMLVRYHPSQWATIVSRPEGNALLPVLRAVNSVVAEFPAMCLSALTARLPSIESSREPHALESPPESVSPVPDESDEQRERREYKLRIRREIQEAQRACGHRRISKTPTVSGAIFTCDGCGKSGDSIGAIRGSD